MFLEGIFAVISGTFYHIASGIRVQAGHFFMRPTVSQRNDALVMQLLESCKNQRHTKLERFGYMKMNGTNQPFILVPQQRIDNPLVGGISGHIDVSHVTGMANQVHNEGKGSEAFTGLNEEGLIGIRKSAAQFPQVIQLETQNILEPLGVHARLSHLGKQFVQIEVPIHRPVTG